MCQGVIISMIKFPVKGKTKRVVLRGIGSHSQLISDNKNKLICMGWREGHGEDVISIESDFSRGFNKFTVESGEPTKTDLMTLKRAYRGVAGDAKRLIAHTKKIGRIDNALVSLLTPLAWAEYEKIKQSAWIKLFRKKENRIPVLQ